MELEPDNFPLVLFTRRKVKIELLRGQVTTQRVLDSLVQILEDDLNTKEKEPRNFDHFEGKWR
jgi:hypothetical protein